MSKVKVASINSDSGDTAAPLVDSSGGVCLFLSRQTLGTATQLTDGSSSGNNAPAGAQGLTINTDGPYP